MTRPSRLRRSELSTPGTSDKMMVKAAASAADLVFLDLEDAVAPSEKEKARQPIVEALNELDWGAKTRAVRVNGTHTQWCADDVTAVVEGAGAKLDIVGDARSGTGPRHRRPERRTTSGPRGVRHETPHAVGLAAGGCADRRLHRRILNLRRQRSQPRTITPAWCR